MPSRRTSIARRGLFLGALAACAACGVEHAFQGDPYRPDEFLPIGEESVRPEAGCDGGSCADAEADAPPPPNLDAGAPPSNTCLGARDIGRVSADKVGPSLQATGTCSEWLKLRATEDDSGFTGAAMKLRVSVVSDDDADLYVYLDARNDVLSCELPFASSTSNGAGGTEIANAKWGETFGGNNSDDSRTVSILVLFPRSACGRNSGWTLVVDGNR